MFRKLTEIAEALDGVVAGLTDLVREVAEISKAAPVDDSLNERLQALEQGRALWEAEIDGLLLKAENQLKSARASEERTRTKAKAYEQAGGDDDQGALAIEEYAEQLRVQIENAGSGGEAGVQPVYEAVEALTAKESAENSKWGIA